MVTVEERNQLEYLAEHKQKVKDRLRRLKVLDRFQQSEEWAALKGELEASIKGHEAGRDMLIEGDGDPIKAMLKITDAHAQIRAFRGVISDVEKASEKMAMLNQRSAEIKQRMDAIQNKHQKQGEQK